MPMAKSLDLAALVETLGPHLAEGAARRDARDIFVVALLALAGLLASPGPAFALPWQPGDVLTYTQVSWPDDATAAALLTNHYPSLYAPMSDVFEVGIPVPSGFSLSFGDASHVLAFLPEAG